MLGIAKQRVRQVAGAVRIEHGQKRPLRAIEVPDRIRAVDRLRAGLMHDIVHSQVLAVGIAVQCRRQQRVVERGVEHPPQSRVAGLDADARQLASSEEHTSELQSLMRISYAVFCLQKKYKHQSEHITASLVHRQSYDT